MGAGTGMRGADRPSPDGIDRRAARRSQRRDRGGGEPARPVRHGHAERDGAAVDEGRGLDQRDDHEHHANRHRRDRAGVCLRARRCAPADAAVAAAYDAARARFGALFAIMLGFLVGTAVGTLAYVATGAWGLLLPLAIMYAIFAWASARPLAQD